MAVELRPDLEPIEPAREALIDEAVPENRGYAGTKGNGMLRNRMKPSRRVTPLAVFDACNSWNLTERVGLPSGTFADTALLSRVFFVFSVYTSIFNCQPNESNETA